MATFIPNVTDVFPEPALFTPDFSFMDKMLQRRQSMYDQGWSQLNAAYNFVNKDLTNPQNLKDRDIFLKQAKNNLKGLAGMDLSQHQNVMSAKGVFEPWINNKKALGDASLTSHWKQQMAIGDGYRLEDGGKYFNQFNVDYIKKQQAAFAGDNAESWEDYWKSKRSYTPYYDYHKEMSDLMKDFKPSTTEIDRVNGLYKYTSKNADWTQAEIRKYLEANLSDNAKQQMKIEADVTYNNSPQQMGQIYTAMAKDEVRQYDAGIAWANSKLKSASKPEAVSKIKEYISDLEDRKRALNLNVEAIGKGDYSFVKKKGEDLAMNIFFNQQMNKVSNGFSHDDHSFKIDADEVALAVYKENKADKRQEASNRFQFKLAQMKGEIAPPAQMNTLSIPEETENVSLATFQYKADQIDAQIDQLTDANKGIVATWKGSLPENKGKIFSTKDITQADIDKFKKEGNNGKPIPITHQFYTNDNEIDINVSKKSAVMNRVTAIKQEIEKNMSADDKKKYAAVKKQIDDLGYATLQDGTRISATQLYQTMQVNKNNVKYDMAVDEGSSISGYTVKIGNKTYNSYDDNSMGGSYSYNPQLAALIEKVRKIQNSDVLKNYDKEIKAYFDKYGKELNYTANLQTFSKGSYEAKTLESEMYNMFPEEKYAIQHAGIGADARDQGSAFFYINGKGDFEPTTESVKAYLNQRGYKDVEAIETTGTGATLYKINNFRSPVISQYNQFNAVEKEILNDLSTDKYTSSGGRYETAKYTSRSNRILQIKKEHNGYYLMVQGLNGGNNMDQFPQTFIDPTGAILMGKYLTSPVNGIPEAQLQWYINNNSTK